MNGVVEEDAHDNCAMRCYLHSNSVDVILIILVCVNKTRILMCVKARINWVI